MYESANYMIKAEVQWLQRNDLTRLDYDAS